MKRNSRKRFRQVQPYLVGRSLLDIGAAEGWVGNFAAESLDLRVQLLDVVNLNQTSLPHTIYEGLAIPYPDKSFDTVTLFLTLHHCADPERTLAEAARVARNRIIVTESVYRTRAGKRFLTFMDQSFNGIRSAREMPHALHFKTVPQWRERFQSHGLHIETERWLSRGLHQQRLFVLKPDAIVSRC